MVIPLTVWLGLTGVWAQEFPGGPVQTRPALISERGSHPVVVVQTVPQATTTATALVLRYAQPGKVGPSSTAAHLLEHLLFRTRPNGRPGELLLRNESLGDRAKAWLDGSCVVFSEEVPSESGLDSLQLQLDRLSGVPRDPEGWKLEMEALRREITDSQAPEDQARRSILAELGFPCEPAGTESTVRETTEDDLARVLSDLDLNADVVIAVVGPHTAREVRQHLSEALRPLAPARSESRKDAPQPPWNSRHSVETSPSGYHQRSNFFLSPQRDPRVVALANTLLSVTLPGRAGLSRETGDLYRLDLSPPSVLLDPALAPLTPELSDRVFSEHDEGWLKRYESLQQRAEMLAQTTLLGTVPDGRISREEYGPLLDEAKKLLRRAQSADVSLTLKPREGKLRDGLFPFATIARREALPNLVNEKLPNGLTVSVQPWEAWPTVALSGFFRVSPPLSRNEVSRLERYLRQRPGAKLTYDVQRSAVFFHGWAADVKAEALLRDSAEELKALSLEDSVLAAAEETDSEFVESFFLGEAPESDPTRRISGRHVFSPESAHLAVVGRFTPEALERGLRPAWSGWFGKSGKPGFPAKTESSVPNSVKDNQIVDLPTGSQPVLLFGFPGPARSSPDFLAFNLALQTLAGRPASSLVEREFQKGPTAVSSVRLIPLSSSDSESRQIWVIALRLEQTLEDPAPVCDRLERMLRALGSTNLPEAELARTRDYLKSSLTLSAATNSGRAGVLAHAEFYRLSRNYAVDFAGLYDHFTPELVKLVCRRALSEEKPRWLYLRPAP